MSNRYVGGYIGSTAATANTIYASGVWTLKQYKKQQETENWPKVQTFNFSNLNPISVNEGANTTFSVNTTNVLTGTQLYWSILHSTSNSFDFITTSNTFTVTNNVGSFIVQTVADLSTEGTEFFQLQVQKTDANGEIILTSGAITLADTSVTPPPPVDVYVVGGGGGQPDVTNLSGGGGSGGILVSNNFTGIVLGTTYTVTVGAGAQTTGTASSVTGTFSIPGSSLIGSGGGRGASSTVSNSFTGGGSGGSGGGGLAYVSSSRFNNQTYIFVQTVNAGGGNSSTNNTLIGNYPGIFTYSVGGGGGALAIGNGNNVNGTSGQTIGAGGGGGGASGSRTIFSLGGTTPNLNGGNGLLSNFDNNNYGGGGASRAIRYSGGSVTFHSGTGGTGGGGGVGGNGGVNTGGGGGGGTGTRSSGGSGIVMFRFETSKLSATASGTRTTSTNGIYTIIRFTDSGTISFTRI
jgi:hypothetical protein